MVMYPFYKIVLVVRIGIWAPVSMTMVLLNLTSCFRLLGHRVCAYMSPPLKDAERDHSEYPPSSSSLLIAVRMFPGAGSFPGWRRAALLLLMQPLPSV